MQKEKILILDFGSQYTELITRKIRELNVFSEVLSFDTSFNDIRDDIENKSIKGIVLSGGPSSIYDKEAFLCDSRILDAGIPLLGICYGMQLIANHFPGGKVEQSDKREYGQARLTVIDSDSSEHSLFNKINRKQINAWMSHGDKIVQTPDSFKLTAKTDNTDIAAFADSERKIHGVQFHPEVNHTECGKQMISNFVLGICGCHANWNMRDFIANSIQEIREKVNNEHVLLALSGGVDSSTLAFLLKEAIGDQLTCMFIDHGFMRKNEPEELMRMFNDNFHMHVVYINAKDRFFEKIQGVSDPEQKRKLIGNEFIKVFEEESLKLKKTEKIRFLAQGTLYPDIIESSGTRIDPKTGKRIAATIKSHHNVGGLPENMPFELIEPIKTLFKDEVRILAKSLGVPDEIVRRHPFPGPGLAIRVLGEVTKDTLRMVADSDFIVREELLKANQYDNVWQILTALLPIKSVGVMGDKRTYAHPIVLRAVTSEDAMTADWAKLPYDLLQRISSRIVNEVDGVNRVVYDITSKPPATIEWE